MADTPSEPQQAGNNTSHDASNATAEASTATAVVGDIPAGSADAKDASNPTAESPKVDSTSLVASDPSSVPKAEATAEDEAGEPTEGNTNAEDGSAVNGTPASARKDSKKRKSGVPEHSKKTPKKKGAKETHLDVNAGDHWWVRTRGYPAWPAVICDEEMLPETLLGIRPVSAANASGRYRYDYDIGGKNAPYRRYPVMYLATNEFNWILNTDLHPLDIDQIKKELQSDNRGKKSKDLWSAYQIASEEHDLQWYKDMLLRVQKEHDEAVEAQAAAEAEKAAKEREKEAKKAAARANKASKDADGDTSMADAGSASAKKADKKRKKSTADAGEDEQATKKLKLKLSAKSTDDVDQDAAKKKPTKKAKDTPKQKDSPKVEEPQLTEEERQEQRKKRLLYLRHRLQKGFLARDQAPKAEDMADMDDYFNQLVAMGELNPTLIRNTKINKVLKAILKLASIPKDEQYNFTGRSTSLLADWNKILGVAIAEPTLPTPTLEDSKSMVNGTNGTKQESETPKPADTASETPKPDANDEKIINPGSPTSTSPPADVAPTSAVAGAEAEIDPTQPVVSAS